MMRILAGLWIVCASIGLLAQAPAPAATPTVMPGVEPTQAVITLQGFCGPDAASQDVIASQRKECTTVVTREQFEKLLHALNPSHRELPAGTERSLAQSYVELMVFAEAARQQGIEHDPDFDAVVSVLRLRALSDLYRRRLEEQFGNPSPQEIAVFYQQNYASYQALKLREISIPRNNLAVDDQQAYSKRAMEVARDLRERVVKGEDMAALQREGYKTLELTDTPPSAEAVTKRPSQIASESEADVIALGNGGVSRVEVEPSAYVIYKLEGKQTVSVDQVKNEIITRIVQQKVSEKMKQLESTVNASFNEQYFGGQKGPALENLH